MNTSESITTII